MAALAQWGLKTKKSLGQHFLIDDHIVGKILDLAKLSKESAVIEVGPGIGTLTLALLNNCAKVFAVEKDESLLPVLAGIRQDYPEKFSYIHADAIALIRKLREPAQADLGICFADHKISQKASGQIGVFAPPAEEENQLWDWRACSWEASRQSLLCANMLVANLPYAVAATIVLAAFEELQLLQSATVMVQREVAQRMMATPRSKDYGAYTVKLQTLVKPAGHFMVAPSCFMPPPKVESCVIRLERVSKNHNQSQTKKPDVGLRDCAKAIFTAADAAFFQRRKTIRNSMTAYFRANRADFPRMSSGVVEQILLAAGVDPASRGEQHSPAEYQKMGAILAGYLAPDSVIESNNSPYLHN
jgi:16S rRNA (adenine1518-N6/adenine1519-N6)-dimethyltransferase